MTLNGSKKSICSLSRVLTTVLVLTSPALTKAQGINRFKDWQVFCKEPETENAAPVCVAEHLTLDQATGKLVMLVRARYSAAKDVMVGSITVPLSVHLPPGLGVKIDSRYLGTIPYRSCLPDGCIAEFLFDDELLGAFKTGNAGMISVRLSTGQTLPIPFSLQGFTAATTALK